MYEILGIFLPLITTNCVILGRADGFACKNSLPAAAYDGLIMGLGFALVLFLLGAARELIGTGAIFANMDLIFGAGAASAAQSGLPTAGHLYMLGAIAMGAIALAPIATSAALRISAE